MKGIYGLALAVALGIGAAALNYYYLWNKSQEYEKVNFIGVKDGATIAQGEPITEDKLINVPVPKMWAKDLEQYAVPAESRSSVIGYFPSRSLNGPTLLLSDDIHPNSMPAQELKLADNERAWGIQVDPHQFPLSLVVPGDEVSFLFPVSSTGAPALAPIDDGGAAEGPVPLAAIPPDGRAGKKSGGGMTSVGPFKVLSLGNRSKSVVDMRANKIPQSQENVLTIAIKYADNQPAEEKAITLRRLWQESGFRPVGIELLPRKTAGGRK
jgi:hypothetical protein